MLVREGVVVVIIVVVIIIIFIIIIIIIIITTTSSPLPQVRSSPENEIERCLIQFPGSCRFPMVIQQPLTLRLFF